MKKYKLIKSQFGIPEGTMFEYTEDEPASIWKHFENETLNMTIDREYCENHPEFFQEIKKKDIKYFEDNYLWGHNEHKAFDKDVIKEIFIASAKGELDYEIKVNKEEVANNVLNTDFLGNGTMKDFPSNFPKMKGWIFKRPDGWKKIKDMRKDKTDIHLFCKTWLCVGKEGGTMFKYCPKCLVITDTHDNSYS